MEKTIKKIINEAADRMGFSFEHRVRGIFAPSDFISEVNFLVPQADSIDVFSYSRSESKFNSIFVIECKGSALDTQMILWAKSQNFIDIKPNTNPSYPYTNFRMLDQLYFTNDEGYVYHELNSAICNPILLCLNQSQYPFSFRYAYTGDFQKIKLKNGIPERSVKFPKDDEENNVFKGKRSLLTVLPVLQDEIREIMRKNSAQYVKIFPIIVTNAKIYVREGIDQNLYEVDWAIYECNSKDQENNKVGIKYMFVVNINSLNKFIQSYG